MLNEIERNLHDAMGVARNVIFHPRLAPGGGATEMAVSVRLKEKAKSIEGVAQWPYRAVAEALEVIPRTLIQNAGRSPVRVLTDLRAKHAEGQHSWGIDGDQGTIVDMKEYKVWEPEAIKLQSMKTAVEVCASCSGSLPVFLQFPPAFWSCISGWKTNCWLGRVSSPEGGRHLQRQEGPAARPVRRWGGVRRGMTGEMPAHSGARGTK